MNPRASRVTGVLLLGVAVALCVSEAWPQGSKPPANPLKDQFLDKGLVIPGVGPYKLPKPLVHEGMTAKELQNALKQAAGMSPYEEFIKGTRYAPTPCDLLEVKDKKGNRHAHHIKLHMIALGKLETVINNNLLTQLIGGSKGKTKPLTAKELKDRKLDLLAAKGVEDRYEVLEMVLDEKVNISGITRTIKTSASKTAFSATILDDRFAKDSKYPNAWQHLDVNGKLVGKPSTYSGMGGYVVAIQLPDRKDDAVYLEMHYIIHEPKAWFGGRERLRSHMRNVVKDNAREFRRKLARENK